MSLWKKIVLLDGAIINLLSATSRDLPTLQAPSDSDFPTAVELVARNLVEEEVVGSRVWAQVRDPRESMNL